MGGSDEIKKTLQRFVNKADARAQENHPCHRLQHARHGEGHRHARVNPNFPGMLVRSTSHARVTAMLMPSRTLPPT